MASANINRSGQIKMGGDSPVGRALETFQGLPGVLRFLNLKSESLVSNYFTCERSN